MKTLNHAFRSVYGSGHLLGAIEILNRVLSSVQVKNNAAAEIVAVLPYVNGRENGFVIVVSGFQTRYKVFFSEYRRSDEWVVYEDSMTQEEHRQDSFKKSWNETEIPSESAWDNPKFFKQDATKKVAAYITKRLEKAIVRVNNEKDDDEENE